MAKTAAQYQNEQSVNASNVFLDVKINATGLKKIRDVYNELVTDPSYISEGLNELYVEAPEITGTIGTPDDKTFVAAGVTTAQAGYYGFFYTKADFDAATDKDLFTYALSVQKLTVAVDGTATVPLDLPTGTDTVIIFESEYHVVQGSRSATESDTATQINVNSVDNNGVMANKNGNRDTSISGTVLFSPNSATLKQIEAAVRYSCAMRFRTGDIRQVGVAVKYANYNVSDFSRSTADQTGESVIERTVNLSIANGLIERDQTADDTLFIGKQIPIGDC